MVVMVEWNGHLKLRWIEVELTQVVYLTMAGCNQMVMLAAKMVTRTTMERFQKCQAGVNRVVRVLMVGRQIGVTRPVMTA
jgi:hypothetical protein